MSPDLCDVLRVLVQAGLALLFLLVGWRLGRESRGRPPFDFPLVAPACGDTVEEADPWDEAARGLPFRAEAMDSFETLCPPSKTLPADRIL